MIPPQRRRGTDADLRPPAVQSPSMVRERFSDLELLEVLGHGRRALHSAGPHGGLVVMPCACGWSSQPRRPEVDGHLDGMIADHLGHVAHAYRDRNLADVVAAARVLLEEARR